jgi:N,N'-diacetyllegionaminate synthase
MVSHIDMVFDAIGDGIKQPAANEVASIIRFRKTMYSSTTIKKGEAIGEHNITYTGPAYGLYAKFEGIAFQMRAAIDIPPNTPISWDLLNS